jgi:hypothetical protein
MIRWLWRVIVGAPAQSHCSRECQWEIHGTYDIWGDPGGARPTKITHLMRCSTCGDLKSYSVEE